MQGNCRCWGSSCCLPLWQRPAGASSNIRQQIGRNWSRFQHRTILHFSCARRQNTNVVDFRFDSTAHDWRKHSPNSLWKHYHDGRKYLLGHFGSTGPVSPCHLHFLSFFLGGHYPPCSHFRLRPVFGPQRTYRNSHYRLLVCLHSPRILFVAIRLVELISKSPRNKS